MHHAHPLPVPPILPIPPILSQPATAASSTVPDIDIILSTQDGLTIAADAAHPSDRIVLLLDPGTVVLPARPNRSPDSFNTPEFEALCHSILAHGGNVTPILVRRLAGDTDIYELVAGERRLRACILAGVPVLAMLAEPHTESQDGLNRLRENTGRQELRPWEAGQQVRALYEQLKPITGVELAARLGMSQATISRALDISSLPPAMVDAFPSPLDIQIEHVKKLKKAWATDSDAVLLEVANIHEERERLVKIAAKDVVERIIKAVAAATRPNVASTEIASVWGTLLVPPAPHAPIALACDGERYGELKRNERGGRELQIDCAMSIVQEGLLVKAIDTFIRHTVRGQPKVSSQVRRSAMEKRSVNTDHTPVATPPQPQGDAEPAHSARMKGPVDATNERVDAVAPAALQELADSILSSTTSM